MINLFSSEDKWARTRRKTTTEAEGRAQERKLLLLIGTAEMEVGRCGGGKLLYLMAIGMEVSGRGLGSCSSSWQLG